MNKQQTFMEAYAPCHDSFTRYCTALAYGKMEVEDLTQDVLLSAYEHYENIRKKDQLLPYLIRAARYRSINNWRRLKFKPELLAEHHGELGASPNSAEKALDTQLLYQALNQLPEKQRDAIILYEITGFSMKEIAEIHKSTEGAVKTKISRGRQKLRKMMDDKPKSHALWMLLAIPDTDYFANHSDLKNRALDEYFPDTTSKIDIGQVNAWIESENLVSSPYWLYTLNIANWVKAGLGIATLVGLLIWVAPKNSPKEKVKKPTQQAWPELLNLVTQSKPTESNTVQAVIPASTSESNQEKVQLVAQANLTQPQKVEAVLKKMYDKLISLKTVRYHLTQEYNYPSDSNYYHFDIDTCYYEFLPKAKPLPFRYQIDNSTSKVVYNMAEKFYLNKSDREMSITKKPQKKSLKQYSHWRNSIITLRNILPLLIKDKKSTKTVVDKVINNRLYKVVTINIGKKSITYMGNKLEKKPWDRSYIYQLTIDPSNYLPVEMIQKNDIDQNVMKTSFSNFNLNPAKPSDDSWYSLTYTQQYKLVKEISMTKIPSPGALAPNWTLPMHTGNKTLSLSDLKGKVVLLDFCIKHSDSRISYAPYFNRLRQKFKHKGFEVVSITSHNTKEEINQFVKRHGVTYPILLNGNNIAKKYGLNGFPTLFIIDKSGKVIYSEGTHKFSFLEVEKIIKKVL